MKTHWPTKALAEVCQIKPPKSEAHEKLSDSDLVSFLPMEDLGIDQKFSQPEQTRSLAEVAGSYTYFAEGDVLLAKITPCFENGKLGIAKGLRNGVGFGSSEYVVFRPDASIEKEWLYYLLSQSTFREEGVVRMTGAVGHKRVTKEFIESYPLPIPPLHEQRRVVSILDQAFADLTAAKAIAQKNLRHASALFESDLQYAFTRRGKDWIEKPLRELSRINYGYTESASAEKVGPHFLRITDIKDDGVDWSTVPYCRMHPNDVSKYKLADGDIVFARTGATTGKSYLVTNPPDSVFASYLIRVRLTGKQLSPRFVNLFFQTHSYWDLIRTGVSGSAQGGFNATKLGELVIPFPKLPSEQFLFASKFDALAAETQRLASLYQRKLAALDELKKSLLHRAFSGAL